MQRAGFVLVGGQSTRMGHDKARLQQGSRFLIEEVAEHVREIAGSVALIGPAHRYRDLPFECFDDIRPNLGPLSGIETALASRRGELNLIVACDMPDLPALPLQRLFEVAETSSARCVVLRDDSDQLHPLCAVWSSKCLTDVRCAIEGGKRRALGLVRQLRAITLDTSAHVSNINTPDDWREWRSSSARSR